MGRGEAEINPCKEKNGPGDRINRKNPLRDKKKIFLDMKKHVATKKE